MRVSDLKVLNLLLNFLLFLKMIHPKLTLFVKVPIIKSVDHNGNQSSGIFPLRNEKSIMDSILYNEQTKAAVIKSFFFNILGVLITITYDFLFRERIFCRLPNISLQKTRKPKKKQLHDLTH